MKNGNNGNKVTVNGGIGFLGLLTILFIGLKLTNYIDWPWVWVLSPLWIPVALLILGFASYLLVFVFLVAFNSIRGNNDR